MNGQQRIIRYLTTASSMRKQTNRKEELKRSTDNPRKWKNNLQNYNTVFKDKYSREIRSKNKTRNVFRIF